MKSLPSGAIKRVDIESMQPSAALGSFLLTRSQLMTPATLFVAHPLSISEHRWSAGFASWATKRVGSETC